MNEKYQHEIDIMNKKENAKTSSIIYRSNKMDKVIDLALRVAKVDSTILIEGESGVGKGVLVQFIHKNSLRYNKPFIKIDCGAIPETLLESELFGYEKGSFTGANTKGKIGLIQLADKGTLFLDEIGELPLNLQVKLLGVIQNKKLTRIGGTSSIPVDIRIIAATNRNLQNMVKEKKFREDLYYRLNVIPITIPPVRERTEDIPPLILHFLNMFNEKYNYSKKIHTNAMKILLNYNWPGNIREIENVIERLIVTTEEDYIDEKNVLDYCQLSSATNDGKLELINTKNFKNMMMEYEKTILLNVMKNCDNTYEMSEILELDSSTIRKKLKNFGIKPKWY